MFTTLLSPDSTNPFPTVTLEGAQGGQVKTATLHGGLQEGVQVIAVDNGFQQFHILPSRGMGIWHGQCKDVRLGWDSPVRDPVHPAYINSQEMGGLGWLKGFNEWVVRCGLASMGPPGPDTASTFPGPLGLHGNIANIPARAASVEISDKRIIVRGEVDETMLFISSLRLSTEISTDLNSGAMTIVDTVTNLGASPQEHQLLYHVNYGTPLLGAGAQFLAPVKSVAPRDARAAEGIDHYSHYDAAEAGYAEQVYLMELAARPASNETTTMLRNAAGDRAAVQRFTTTDFPYFTQWKNTAADADGYVTGLEPGTSFPYHRSNERDQGRVITLAPGQSRTTKLTLETLTSAAEVAAVSAEIADIQAVHTAQIHQHPVYCLSG